MTGRHVPAGSAPQARAPEPRAGQLRVREPCCDNGVLELRKFGNASHGGGFRRVVCAGLFACTQPSVDISDRQEDPSEAGSAPGVPSHPGSWKEGHVCVPRTGSSPPQEASAQLVTRSFSHPQPEEPAGPAGQALHGGGAGLSSASLVSLEKYASWRCEVWKALSHLAEGTGKTKCLRDLHTGSFPQRLGPRQTPRSNRRLCEGEGLPGPGFCSAPAGAAPSTEQGLGNGGGGPSCRPPSEGTEAPLNITEATNAGHRPSRPPWAGRGLWASLQEGPVPSVLLGK
nr:uncharacterized protein LOC116280878 [Vicugna pacos]